MITPESALALVQAQFPSPLTLQGKFTGGETGAYQVIDDHQICYSLKIYDYPEAAVDLPLVRDYLTHLKSRGYPAPQIITLKSQDHFTVVLQEFVPGEPLEPLTPNFLPQILALNQLQAKLIATPSDWPKVLIDTLFSGGHSYCLHSSLTNYSATTRQILSQLKAIAPASTHLTCAQTDLVHFDFHGGNIFAVNSQLSGVIDWAGACLGDRFFDLTTLVYYYYLDSSLRQPVEAEVLKHISKDTLRLYYAHMILRQLDWSIRHHSPKAITGYLTISQQILKDYPN